MLDVETAASSLGVVLGLGVVDEGRILRCPRLARQAAPAIEKSLARKHLKNGARVLHDVPVPCGGPLVPARFGYNRDGKKGELQVVYGLLRSADDYLNHVVLVGDRGVITQARIDAELKPAGLDWIAALRVSAIRALI